MRTQVYTAIAGAFAAAAFAAPAAQARHAPGALRLSKRRLRFHSPGQSRLGLKTKRGKRVRQLLQSMQRRAMLRIGSLAIVLITVAALAAPVALADKWGTARTSDSGATLRPDDRSGVRGSGPTLLVATGASGTGYVVPAGSAEAIVNDAGSAGASGTGYVVPAGSAEAIVNDAGSALRPDDRSGVRGSGPILLAAPVAPVVTVQAEDASFQWGDAGIGAGVVFIAMMFAVGGIALVARHRSARASTI